MLIDAIFNATENVRNGIYYKTPFKTLTHARDIGHEFQLQLTHNSIETE